MDENREEDLFSYVTTYLEEEIRSEALVRNVGAFGNFLKLAALESGLISNFHKLSQDVGVSAPTISEYYQILVECLLEYVMDGKNSLVAVKDRSGKIIARSILRLLVDREKKPVLFLEYIYPFGSSHSGALLAMAQKKAEQLGVRLLTSETRECYAKSLGSCAPHEYCDAVRGVTNGEYVIDL